MNLKGSLPGLSVRVKVPFLSFWGILEKKGAKGGTSPQSVEIHKGTNPQVWNWGISTNFYKVGNFVNKKPVKEAVFDRNVIFFFNGVVVLHLTTSQKWINDKV